MEHPVFKPYRKPGRPRKFPTVGRAEGTTVITDHTAGLLLRCVQPNGWQNSPYSIRESNRLMQAGLILVHISDEPLTFAEELHRVRLTPHGYTELAKWVALQAEQFFTPDPTASV